MPQGFTFGVIPTVHPTDNGLGFWPRSDAAPVADTWFTQMLRGRIRAQLSQGKVPAAPKTTGMTWLYPFPQERAYYLLINKEVSRWMDLYIGQVANQYKRWLAEGHHDARQDDASADNAAIFDRLMGAQKAEFDGLQGGNFLGAIFNIGQKVADFNEQQFQKFVKKAVGENFYPSEPWLTETLDFWSKTNFSLVKSLAAEGITRLNTTVSNAVQNGTMYTDVMRDLRKTEGNMSVARARLLARDQIGKLNGKLTQRRQTDAGIEAYEWQTTGDERVRGNPTGKWSKAIPSHYLMDGKLCQWGNNAVYAEKGTPDKWVPRTGKMPQAVPGWEIQCRCSGLPYMEPLFAELVRQEQEIAGTVVPGPAPVAAIPAPKPAPVPKPKAAPKPKVINPIAAATDRLKELISDADKSITPINLSFSPGKMPADGFHTLGDYAKREFMGRYGYYDSSVTAKISDIIVGNVTSESSSLTSFSSDWISKNISKTGVTPKFEGIPVVRRDGKLYLAQYGTKSELRLDLLKAAHGPDFQVPLRIIDEDVLIGAKPVPPVPENLTSKTASAWMRAYNLARTGDLSKLSSAAAQDVATFFRNYANDFGVFNTRSVVAKEYAGAVAYCSTVQGQQLIYEFGFSPTRFIHSEKLLAMSQHPTWWSVGASGEAATWAKDAEGFSKALLGVMEHEMGHGLSMGLVPGFTDLPEIKTMFDELRVYAKATGKPGSWVAQDKIKAAELLSAYGTTNAKEMVAEAWSEYRLSKNPRKYAKKIGDALARELVKYKEAQLAVPVSDRLAKVYRL